MNIICLKTDEATFKAALRDKLREYGYDDYAKNDFFMCPFLIVRKDLDDYSKAIFENINQGYLDAMKKNVFCKVIEVSTTKEFLEEAKKVLQKDEKIGLF